MEQERMIKLKDFFDFDSQEPINRLAYTKEDMKYKIKVIEKMKALGMKITMDKAGNICGTISVGHNPQKTLAIGSHTDSVYDGGQYDGTVGVIVGLQVAENLIKSNKCTGIIKVPIYACEESSRFGNACLGSKYLNGTITPDDFSSIVDQKAIKAGKTITLQESIDFARSYLKEHVDGIEEVDKIFDTVDYSLEAHTEQYDSLHKAYKKAKQDTVGIINSVGSSVRIKYYVKGKADHSGSTPMNERKNAVDATSYIGKKVLKLGKRYEKQGLGRASQVEINTPEHNGSFNQLSGLANGLIDFRLQGENTPEAVLEEFEKMRIKAEKKTRTKISTTVVSKGAPVVTSKTLNQKLAQICDQKGIQSFEMPSFPGQDTGYIPAKEKTMIFIPSTGGSHNPEEHTKKKFIKPATTLFTELAKELLLEKFRDSQKVDVAPKPISAITQEQSAKVSEHTISTDELSL